MRFNGYFLVSLIGGLLLSVTTPAQSFLQQAEQATPANRVVRLLNYFDTCQATIQNQAYAFRLLADIDALARRTRDERLTRYVGFVRKTHSKHQKTDHAKNAALFLAVGGQAEQAGDKEIAAVCEHFAGQYFFLNEQYGPAFEHLLLANRAFAQIGYGQVPGVSRYLYELAYNYYYFREYDRAIALLGQAARYPAFNANLAIQTYNTMGLAYGMAQHQKTGRDGSVLADRSFLKARQLANSYGDSLWVGIISVNLGNEYGYLKKWSDALSMYRVGYTLIRRFGQTRELPSEASLQIGHVFYHLGRLDSCRYYLEQTTQFRQRKRIAQFGTDLEDEYGTMHYLDLSRLYYRAVGDLPVAYRYLDSLTVLKERINKRYNASRLSLVEQKLQIQQHQAEVEAIEAEKKAQQVLFWIAGVGLLLIAGLFFRLYQLAQLKRRQGEAINAGNEKTLRLQNQLVETELKRVQADLGHFVNRLHERDVEDTKQQRHLLGANLLTKDNRDEFQRRFELLYPGFLGQLKHHIPDISPAEERLMALSKLNIDNRQMSRMLGISPDSLRKARYRLRKKVGINGQSPLTGLLVESSEQLVTN